MRGLPGNVFWTDARKTALREAWARGDDDVAMAAEFGATLNAIRIQRHHQGLVCRKIKRASIRDYNTQQLLAELVRRGVKLPKRLWTRKPRELDPDMAGGIVTF